MKTLKEICEGFFSNRARFNDLAFLCYFFIRIFNIR